MNIHTCNFFAAILLMFSTTSSAFAQENEQRPHKAKYAVGFQSSFPTFGFSGVLDISEQVSAQAIIGFSGEITTIGGRVLYRVQQKEWYDFYGFGVIGIWRYRGVFETENVVGFGGGGGLEFSWGKLLDIEDFPPVYSNVELGLTLASFEYYNFSALTYGAGIHYKF